MTQVRARYDLAVLCDAARITIYSRLMVVAYVIGFALLIAISRDLVDPSGKPLGYDFITFWSAGALALSGEAARAFDMASIVAAQRAVVPGSDAVFLWHYPPTFQLIAAGLALMPYAFSYFAFVTLSLLAYVAVLRPLVPWREAAVLLAAFPGTFIAVLHGQNSLLTAALIAGALLMLDKRPIVAGMCIGLLAYKPQMAVLFPLVLVVTGRWRVFGAAAVTAIGFVALSTVAFGVDLWREFLANTGVVARVMATGELPWQKMPSAFAMLATLGASQAAAYVGQIVVAFGATFVTALVWWRCGPRPLAGATLAAATLLISPYMFDYELAILAIPLAILARDMVDRGATRVEKLVLLVLFLSPLLITAIAKLAGVQAGAVFLTVACGWSALRALRHEQITREHPMDWLPGRMFPTLN